MKFKKMMFTVLAISSLLALGACSAPGHKDQDTAVYDANGEAAGPAATGAAADSANFGDNGDDTLAQRTYYFEFDKSDIRDEDKPAISANADYLAAHPDAKITLEGHTDPRGSREYNVALGERRANAVADFLKAKGVNASQIRVVSYGAEQLGAPGHTEADFKMDRRAIIVYSKK